MQSAREYLKELIDRGNVLQNPKQPSLDMIHSASLLPTFGPTREEMNAWLRDVKTYAHHYLKEHYLYSSIYNASNGINPYMLSSIITYLEYVYTDWDFWEAKESTVSTVSNSQGKEHLMYDVFVSHANADKESYVDKLKTSLDKLKIKIFYDKDTLEWGDDWKKVILEGVSKAEFAIIVISKNFFGREWTEKELNEFLNRQNHNGQKCKANIYCVF